MQAVCRSYSRRGVNTQTAPLAETVEARKEVVLVSAAEYVSKTVEMLPASLVYAFTGTDDFTADLYHELEEYVWIDPVLLRHHVDEV